MEMAQSLCVAPENFYDDALEDELVNEGRLYDNETVYMAGDIPEDHIFEEGCHRHHCQLGPSQKLLAQKATGARLHQAETTCQREKAIHEVTSAKERTVV